MMDHVNRRTDSKPFRYNLIRANATTSLVVAHEHFVVEFSPDKTIASIRFHIQIMCGKTVIETGKICAETSRLPSCRALADHVKRTQLRWIGETDVYAGANLACKKRKIC